MISKARLGFLLRIALIPTALIVMYFTGLLPLEDYFAYVPARSLTASVVPVDVASLTNAQRVQKGLPVLSINPLLTQAAQEKADDMAKNSYYAHVSPDGKSPLYWLNAVGYKYLNAGENLVIDRKTSSQAVEAWMNSPEHRENILRPQFTEIGVGVAAGRFEGQDTIYVVQEFGTPYPLSNPAPRPATIKPVVVQVPVKVPVTKPVAAVSSTLPTNVAIVPVAPVVPSLVTEIRKITAPVVKSIATPVTKKAPVEIRPAVSSSTPAAQATSTTATTSPNASSSVIYTLAPEFYTAISLTAGSGTGSDTRLAAPGGEVLKPNLIVRVKNYIRTVFNDVPRLWH